MHQELMDDVELPLAVQHAIRMDHTEAVVHLTGMSSLKRSLRQVAAVVLIVA